MTKAIDKLLKLIDQDNIADSLEDDHKVKIVQDVLQGYQTDEDSRSAWLDTNQEAMRIIKHCENDTDEDTLDTPVYKAAKVIYPLLSPAIIQLASRMIVHIVRNDRVVEVAVLGKDIQIPEDPEAAAQYEQFQQQMQQMGPQIQQMQQQNPEQAQQLMQQLQQQAPQPPKMVWKKKDRAKRVSDYMNYKFLVESDTWLKDKHKLCHIIASWGTGFTQVYYDKVSKRNCNDLISPEDVIINHKISTLEKAPRVTIRHYMTVNDILEQIRSGYFSDIDIDLLKTQKNDRGSETEELQPAAKVYCQYTYLDLDEDGYAEPYKVYVHEGLQKLLGIYPAFDYEDIKISEKGEIIKIKRVLDIVDDHLIDDPEGGFYSIGLNYLLLHQNKSITSILRQLLDAGALANAAGCTGFITNAFKTRERNLEFKLGEYKTIDVNPNVNPMQHVIPLPARDPSQVLVGLLQMLIQGGEKTGFITDVLTGDIAGQNVPATTMLSMIEEGTRAFKPVIEKFWIARKKEFKLDFRLNGKYLDEEQYVTFQDGVIRIGKEDFVEQDMDICPVADPTQSSESHKYAKMQFILQLLATQAVGGMNIQENLLELYKGMEYDNPERFIQQPAPPPPDPKMEKIKLDAQKLQVTTQQKDVKMQMDFKHKEDKSEINKLHAQLDILKAQLAERDMKATEAQAYAAAKKMVMESRSIGANILLKEREVDIKKQEADTNRIEASKPDNSNTDN